MRILLRIYRLLNVLSLDVAAGAVICASFFARIFNVAISPQGLISLGLTVWIIYTADHLLDVKKLSNAASTERHRFHQRHFRVLLTVMLLASLFDAIQIYFISDVLFVDGLWLSIVVAAYFLVQQRLGFLKELFGALLYTSGVLLISISVKNILASAFVLLVIQFGLTAWINLLLFSWIDQAHDERDRHRSFATTFGRKITGKLIIFLGLVQALVTLVQLVVFRTSVPAVSTIALMNIFLMIIFFRSEFFEKNDRYRLLGDAVFLLPLLYFLF